MLLSLQAYPYEFWVATAGSGVYRAGPHQFPFAAEGFWMDGTIGLEFTVDPQPQNVSSKNWYMGIFVDCRFANDTTSRRLLTFPDGTSVQLYGRNQVIYADAGGNIVHRVTIPPVDTTTPASAMDDLLRNTGWAHLAFQVKSAGTQVDFISMAFSSTAGAMLSNRSSNFLPGNSRWAFHLVAALLGLMAGSTISK